MKQVRGKKELHRFPKIDPVVINGAETAADLVKNTFLAYNAGRLREGCELFVTKMLCGNGLVGLSVTGALTPAGLGRAAIIPMMKAGFIDWIVSTGANLYHDLHLGLGMTLRRASPFLDDVELRRQQIVRIYDVVLDYDVLVNTDAFICKLIKGEEFQRTMGTDEFHYLLGKYVNRIEKKLGLGSTSLVSAAYKCGIPIFTSSPGDSAIGMNVAAMALKGNKLRWAVSRDVNQTTSFVYDAKIRKRTSSVLILGGGSPKNFMLQTEPQLQEIMGLKQKGHDHFLQITDARADTGGLSGATPSEGVSWGKIDPDALPNCVVCYTDSTIALPLLASYALSRAKRRKLKRLFDKRDALLKKLAAAFMNWDGTKQGTIPWESL